MKPLFILISSLLALISPLIYSRAILKGKARPHRTTRFVILLTTALSTAALFAQHDTVAIWLAGVSALQAILILALSLKRGMGGWAKIDILCLMLAILGIIFWQTTKDPAIGLYFEIAADFTGMVPALIKTYHLPETEIWSFFLLDVFAAGFSLLALKSWTVHEAAYPLYIMLINSLMVFLIVAKPKTGTIKSTG